jgi:hypothetical protein
LVVLESDRLVHASLGGGPHGGVQEKVVEGGEVYVHGPPGHRSAASGMTMPAASPLRRQSTTAWLMRSPGTTTGMPGG